MQSITFTKVTDYIVEHAVYVNGTLSYETTHLVGKRCVQCAEQARRNAVVQEVKSRAAKNPRIAFPPGTEFYRFVHNGYVVSIPAAWCTAEQARQNAVV